MKETDREDCPLCTRAVDGRGGLRIHLMVEHRKGTVIDEYVGRLWRTAVAPP